MYLSCCCTIVLPDIVYLVQHQMSLGSSNVKMHIFTDKGLKLNSVQTFMKKMWQKTDNN